MTVLSATAMAFRKTPWLTALADNTTAQIPTEVMMKKRSNGTTATHGAYRMVSSDRCAHRQESNVVL